MFFLLTGLLAEALQVLERCGKHFRHLAAHSEWVRPLLSDTDVAALRGNFLKPLRNQAVFHHDGEVSQRGLAIMRPGIPQDLVRSTNDDFMDINYPISDLAAVLFMLESSETKASDAEKWMRESLTQSVALGYRVCHTIDNLAVESLAAWGFEREDHDDATP